MKWNKNNTNQDEMQNAVIVLDEKLSINFTDSNEFL